VGAADVGAADVGAADVDAEPGQPQSFRTAATSFGGTRAKQGLSSGTDESRPMEIRDWCAFLAYDAARLITGRVLYVDGGYHIIYLQLLRAQIEFRRSG
jgi:enoyl-[acyl-carrier-protein] reductase (NADH)